MYKTEYVKKYIKNYGESVLEDYLFNIQYFEHVNKYVYTDDVLYYYRILTDSLSKKYNKNAYGVLKEIQIKKDTFIKIMKMNSADVELYNYFWFVNYTKNILFTLFLSSNLHDIISSLKIAKSIVLSKELLNYAKMLNGTKLDNPYSKFLNLKLYNILLLGIYMKAKVYSLYSKFRGLTKLF